MPRGRPKGSKNKTTITKEEVNVKIEGGNFTPEEQETYAKMLKKNSVDTGINVNNIMSETEVGAEDEDISMEGVIENPPEDEKRNISPKVKKNNVPVCSRCGKEIKTTPYRLNLTYLSGGVASWHRYTADDKPILCKECASELSGMIDKWLIEGGAETKFPVPNMVGVDVSEAEDTTVVNNKFVNKKIENKEENKEEDFDF